MFYIYIALHKKTIGKTLIFRFENPDFSDQLNGII